MRNWTLSTLAAIAVVLTMPVKSATAMPVATADQLGLAVGASGSVEKAALLCDAWTCVWRPGYWPPPYPYSGWRRHYWWVWRGLGWGWRRPWRG